LVMLIEDLHWIDEPSRELLETLVARLANAPVMVVTTQRPDERATWRARAAFTQIVLRPLSDDDTRAIIRAVAGAPLPAELEHRKSLSSADEYRFGESLTQEVAYESLLLRQRRQLHERIGTLLETSPGKPNAERSALLAYHFARSENRPKALEALLRAAQDAEQLPSYRAAVDFYRQAWEVAEAALAEDGDGPYRRA